MYTKEAIVEATERYLKMEGYDINPSSTIGDIHATKAGEILKVVAMGAVNDASSTSKKGKGFNKNQVRTNLALALFEIARLKTMTNDHRYVIALPESKIYNKMLKEIEVGFRELNIRIIQITETGIINDMIF